MTVETIVIKRYKSFKFGCCWCGCGKEMKLTTWDGYLRWYIKGHNRLFGNDNNNNPSWKGDNVGIEALHNYIHKRLPKPEFCTQCGNKKRLDLANITGIYNRELNNWKYLCRKCHIIFDTNNPITSYRIRDPITGRFHRR